MSLAISKAVLTLRAACAKPPGPPFSAYGWRSPYLVSSKSLRHNASRRTSIALMKVRAGESLRLECADNPPQSQLSVTSLPVGRSIERLGLMSTSAISPAQGGALRQLKGCKPKENLPAPKHTILAYNCLLASFPPKTIYGVPLRPTPVPMTVARL